MSLPFLWWPVKMSGGMLAHVAVSLGALGFVAHNFHSGRLFDHERNRVRGYLGVVAFAAVFMISMVTYRWLLL